MRQGKNRLNRHVIRSRHNRSGEDSVSCIWRKKRSKRLIKIRFLNSSIELLNDSSLLNLLKPVDEGKMAFTWLVEVEWSAGCKSRAYLKAFPLNHRLGVLNEITGYILARRSGLPISSRAGVIRIPDGLFSNMTEIYPFAFVSSEVPGSSPNSMYELPSNVTSEQLSPVIELLREWKYLPNCLAFDDWTANTDRHCGNIIFAGHGKIYMIDHSNLPVGIAWNSFELIDNYEYENRLAKYINFTGKSELYKKVEVSNAAMNHPMYYQLAFKDLQLWWDILLSEDKDRRDSLERFIQNRAQNGHQRICRSLQILEV